MDPEQLAALLDVDADTEQDPIFDVPPLGSKIIPSDEIVNSSSSSGSSAPTVAQRRGPIRCLYACPVPEEYVPGAALSEASIADAKLLRWWHEDLQERHQHTETTLASTSNSSTVDSDMTACNHHASAPAVETSEKQEDDEDEVLAGAAAAKQLGSDTHSLSCSVLTDAQELSNSDFAPQ